MDGQKRKGATNTKAINFIYHSSGQDPIHPISRSSNLNIIIIRANIVNLDHCDGETNKLPSLGQKTPARGVCTPPTLCSLYALKDACVVAQGPCQVIADCLSENDSLSALSAFTFPMAGFPTAEIAAPFSDDLQLFLSHD